MPLLNTSLSPSTASELTTLDFVSGAGVSATGASGASSTGASDAVAGVFNMLRRANKYIDETTPWALAKDEEKRAYENGFDGIIFEEYKA